MKVVIGVATTEIIMCAATIKITIGVATMRSIIGAAAIKIIITGRAVLEGGGPS